MTFDLALSWVNFILLSALLALLIWRRVYRSLPVFVAYQAYDILFGIPGLLHTGGTTGYVLIWSIGIAIDTFFFLWVSLELGKRVFRYNQATAWPAAIFFLLFAGAGLPIALLLRWEVPVTWSLLWHVEFRVMQTSAVLETAGLLTLAWWTAFMRLRWPERELRLVMGLGAWTIAQSGVLILHEHGFLGPQYRWIDFLMPLSVLGILIYWLHYFWLSPGAAAPETGPGSGDERARSAQSGVGHSSRMSLAAQC